MFRDKNTQQLLPDGGYFMRKTLAIICLALGLFISISTPYAVAKEVGPKIFGLQLGMPWEDAVATVKKICDNLEEEHWAQNTHNFTCRSIMIDEIKGILNRIQLDSKIFNVDSIFTDGQINQIREHYKIPEDKKLQLENGYEIEFVGRTVLLNYRVHENNSNPKQEMRLE